MASSRNNMGDIFRRNASNWVSGLQSPEAVAEQDGDESPSIRTRS